MLKENKKYFPTVYALLVSVLIISAAACTYFTALLMKSFLSVRIAVYIIKIAFALSVISSPMSSEAKYCWVFLILAIPYAAIPVYIIFCRTRLSRKEKEILASLEKKKPKIESFGSKMALKCDENFTFLREIAGYSNANIYNNTSADYIESAEKMLDLLCRDIERARRFIFLEFYTVASGSVFGKICKLLIEKAALGVEVRLIYDELGSILRIPEDFPALMREKGINAVAHASLTGSFPAALNNRNHRKIAVIDGEIAYTGGINLADEYVYSRPRLGKWKDSAIRICGEGVQSMTYTFLSDYSLTSGIEEDFSKYYKYRKCRCKGQALIFDDGPSPFYVERRAKRTILAMLNSAEKYFSATTPYLVCDCEILSAIRAAMRRGVRVRIAIPGMPDKFFIGLLTRHYAARLCEMGAEIYVYKPGFLHSKQYIADGRLLLFGTVNLDYRSLFHNFENCVLFSSHSLIIDAERDMECVFSDSVPLKRKKESLPMRLLGAVIEIFAPLF